MREGTKRRVRMFAWMIAAGILIGIAFGGLIGYAGWGQALTGGQIGAIHGAIIAASIGLLEIFAVRTTTGRRVEQAPLVLTVGIKGLIYCSVILAVEFGNIGETIVLGGVSDPGTTSAFTPLSIAFSFIITFAIIFLLQVGRLVGGRTLCNLVLGRYHRPRMEERFFLFVDLVGSTQIAETIGPLSVHRLLNRVFAVIADPVADRRGEIYQYVGDEIVITWKVAAGRCEARPLACFFAIQSALADAEPLFKADFDVAPTIRGALHAGPVVAGEVGVNRRSIVFHGDVMNVCARLEQATRDMDSPFLVSGEALRLLEGIDDYHIRDHGRRMLRGRQAPMQVFAVSPKNF
jgi:adenylate cyclase